MSNTHGNGHGHDDFAFEPIRGLPETPPEGERILWQGAPCWKGLAIRSFHVRKVAIYFATLAVWSVTEVLYDGGTIAQAAFALGGLAPLAAGALGLLTLFAYLYARTSVFTITSRRVVMRFGLALPMAINLPFTKVDGAAHRQYRDGRGDIPLQLKKGERIAWLHLWPFARPWNLRQPQPTMKALVDSQKAATILADALGAFVATEAELDQASQTPATQTPPSKPARLAGAGNSGMRATLTGDRTGSGAGNREPAVAAPNS
jgi:hypothetical protein